MIEVRSLRKRYDDQEAVRGISFDVGRGEIFGFIGPNGAGKTTTIRIMATLLDPTGGDILVAGHSVVEAPEKVRLALGFMPDAFGVYERITVWEYLDFFGASYGLDRARRRRAIDDILMLTDLAEMRERLCSALSKGNRQRLALARTLIHDPSVLVLDEPASGLDPRARIEFRALLKELRAMGKTILLSSHILTELSDVCTSVAIMEKGSIVAAGSIEEIHKRFQPRRRFTITVLERAEEVTAMLLESGAALDVEGNGFSVAFSLEGDLRKLSEIVKAVAARDIPVVGLREDQQNLEGLFMQLTRGDVS